MKKLGIVALLLGTSFAVHAQQNKGFEVGMAVDQQLSVVFEIDDQYRFILGNDGAAFDQQSGPRPGSIRVRTGIPWR